MGVAKPDFLRYVGADEILIENAECFTRIDLDLSDFEKERTQCHHWSWRLLSDAVAVIELAEQLAGRFIERCFILLFIADLYTEVFYHSVTAVFVYSTAVLVFLYILHLFKY